MSKSAGCAVVDVDKPVPSGGEIDTRRFYRIRQIVETTGLTRAHIYQLLHDGELEAVTVGKAVLVSAESVERLLAAAPPWMPWRGRAAPSSTRQQKRIVKCHHLHRIKSGS